MNHIKIAVVGASGLVGRKAMEILLLHGYYAKNIFCFASKKSKNKTMKIKLTNSTKQNAINNTKQKKLSSKSVCKGSAYKSKTYQFKISELTVDININFDIAIFCAGKAISKIFAPVFAKNGCFVVDNSSAFRRAENVPLIVPEINADSINKNTLIIANPNCSTIQMVLPVFAVDKVYKIKRIVVSTYQAVSGAGKAGLDDLNKKRIKNLKKFVFPIYNNIIPHIDEFLADGNTREEDKMIFETKKILNNSDIQISATCVRIPVQNCHSESVNIEFYQDFDINVISDILKNTQGIKLHDNPQNCDYPMPLISNDKDDIFVGRIRRDNSTEFGLNLWITADNIRKGAALNAVQICDYIVKEIL